jgi:hypothetical protein
MISFIFLPLFKNDPYYNTLRIALYKYISMFQCMSNIYLYTTSFQPELNEKKNLMRKLHTNMIFCEYTH